MLMEAFGSSMEKNNLSAVKHGASLSGAVKERRRAEPATFSLGNCPIFSLNERKAECPISSPDEKKVQPATHPSDRKNAVCPIVTLEPPDSENSNNIHSEVCGKDKKEELKSFGEAPAHIIRAGGRQPPANLSEGQANPSPLSNYRVFPIKKLVFVDRFGRKHNDKEEIVCQIKIEDSEPEEFSILTQDIKRLTVIIGDKFSGAWVNPDMAHAAKTIENTFRSETQRIPVSKIYIDHGWQVINGRRVYAHDGQYFSETITFQTGMTLPSYHSS